MTRQQFAMLLMGMWNSLCLLQTSKLILTMVFALRAEVDARGPLKRFKADAQLYEFKEFEVKLTNPFQVKPAELEIAWQHWLELENPIWSYVLRA